MYTFYVKTEEAKRKWLEAVERAQENVRPKALARTDHKFAMSTVPVATYCACCAKILRGTWYQGYLCTVCSVSVHKACIANVKGCGSCSVLVPGTTAISVRKDSLVQSTSSASSSSSEQMAGSIADAQSASNAVTLRGYHLRLNSGTSSTYRSQVSRSVHGSIMAMPPPTPSKTSRTIAKAISTNYGGNGQLAFLPNDTIIVFSKHGTASWYGKNVRTEEEGTFSASLVTELATDSPASSSLESPTVGASPHGHNGPLRFSYEDPFNSHPAEGQHYQQHFAFPTMAASCQTLPRKWNGSAGNTPSPQTALMLMPSSPLAASTPVLNLAATQGSQSSGQSNFFNFNADAEATSRRLIFGNGFNLEEYAWFAGAMDRDTAQSTLSLLPHGCFLVRISPKQKNSYAISIKYSGAVKHMRVCVTEQAGITPTTVHSKLNLSSSSDASSPSAISTSSAGPTSWPYKTHFYLSETRYFRTIVDLIRWYELNSLSESFNMVNTPLLLPYKKAYCTETLGTAIALYSFTGSSTPASSFLSLKKGDQLTVLSRAAEDKGWWKGTIGDRIGYFPFKYVSPRDPEKLMLSGWTTNESGASQTLNRSASSESAKMMPSASLFPILPGSFEAGVANITATTVDSLSISSAMTETSNLSPTGDQSFLGGPVGDSSTRDSPSGLENEVLVTKDDVLACSPSGSPSFCSSASSSSSSSASASPATQSSPVNSVESSGHSETSSLHSRQPSSDAGIEVPPFSGSNQSPPPPPLHPPPTSLHQQPVTCFSSLSAHLTHPPPPSTTSSAAR